MSDSRGFSLLEMVVAFAIMGLALSLLLTIFSRNVNQVQVAEDYLNATRLAQGLLARVGHEWPVRESDFAGVENGRYQWRVLIEPAPADSIPASALNQEITPMAVTVTVRFGDDFAEPREVTLQTLRLAA